MAELADAADSKSAEGNLVGVRPPLPAPMNQDKSVLSVLHLIVCACLRTGIPLNLFLLSNDVIGSKGRGSHVRVGIGEAVFEGNSVMPSKSLDS